jgi:HlyD family secretion protein
MVYLGYVEGDYIYVSFQQSGQIVSLAVERGDMVMAGQLIGRLDDTEVRATLAQVQAELAEQQARLADLLKGERPEELEIMRAQIDQAKAALRRSEPDVARRRELVKRRFDTQANLDVAESQIANDRNKLAEMEARLHAAEMPARSDQIDAARAAIATRQAAIRQVEWRRTLYDAYAPEAGRIEDVYFRPGERVMANQPIVQLLPPGRVKLRFYVPETILGQLHVGQAVTVNCDGCAQGLKAHVRFLAHQAEYTPPVIYSRESRAKLVYLVEAVPDDLGQPWHPGQPVDIRLKQR